jgi:hypothetical protein
LFWPVGPKIIFGLIISLWIIPLPIFFDRRVVTQMKEVEKKISHYFSTLPSVHACFVNIEVKPVVKRLHFYLSVSFNLLNQMLGFSEAEFYIRNLTYRLPAIRLLSH